MANDRTIDYETKVERLENIVFDNMDRAVKGEFVHQGLMVRDILAVLGVTPDEPQADTRCPEYRYSVDVSDPTPEHDAIYRCVYHAGHDGPHWVHGTKWWFEEQAEQADQQEPRTGAERYLRDRANSPDYRDAYDRSRAQIDASNTPVDWRKVADEMFAMLDVSSHPLANEAIKIYERALEAEQAGAPRPVSAGFLSFGDEPGEHPAEWAYFYREVLHVLCELIPAELRGVVSTLLYPREVAQARAALDLLKAQAGQPPVTEGFLSLGEEPQELTIPWPLIGTRWSSALPLNAAGVQEVWDAFVKPDQDTGLPLSFEMRCLMAILRAVYDGLMKAEGDKP